MADQFRRTTGRLLTSAELGALDVIGKGGCGEWIAAATRSSGVTFRKSLAEGDVTTNEGLGSSKLLTLRNVSLLIVLKCDLC